MHSRTLDGLTFFITRFATGNCVHVARPLLSYLLHMLLNSWARVRYASIKSILHNSRYPDGKREHHNLKCFCVFFTLLQWPEPRMDRLSVARCANVICFEISGTTLIRISALKTSPHSNSSAVFRRQRKASFSVKTLKSESRF